MALTGLGMKSKKPLSKAWDSVSLAEPETVSQIDNDKCVKWLLDGAQPTERVAKLLATSGALAAFEAAKRQVVDTILKGVTAG